MFVVGTGRSLKGEIEEPKLRATNAGSMHQCMVL